MYFFTEDIKRDTIDTIVEMTVLLVTPTFITQNVSHTYLALILMLSISIAVTWIMATITYLLLNYFQIISTCYSTFVNVLKMLPVTMETGASDEM